MGADKQRADGRLRPGEGVSWRSHGETVHGRVEEEITRRTESAGRVVAASRQAPQYRVRSDKSGGDAVHKPEALRHERYRVPRDRDSADRDTAYRRFRDAVNLNAGQLERWLDSDQSKAVGQKGSARAESTGHRSGRRIVALLRKRKSELTDADLSHMRKVVGYVARHMAQRPSGDVRETRWRYSLMNWGHDPLRA